MEQEKEIKTKEKSKGLNLFANDEEDVRSIQPQNNADKGNKITADDKSFMDTQVVNLQAHSLK